MTPRAIRSLGVLSFILGTACAAVWQPHGLHAESVPCTAPTETPPTTDAPPAAPTPTTYADPRFNEVFPDPEGTDTDHEFIELRNAGPTGTLDGWVLETAAGKTYALASTLPADGYVSLPYATTKISLLNAGMTLTLRDAQGAVRDTLTYGASKAGKTYARKGDGTWDWTASATPGSANAFSEPVVPPPNEPAEEPEPTVTEPPPVIPTIDPATVITLSEFIPDPEGSDDGEWIELRNAAAVEIPLDGLLLDDIEGGSAPFALHGFTIAPNAWLVIPKASSKINLNNDADSVRLLTAAGVVIQQTAYVNAPVGKARALVGDSWVWAAPTPGEENAAATQTQTAAVTGTASAEMPPADGTPTTEEPTVLDVGSLDEASDELLQVEAVVTLPPGRIGTRTFAVSDAAGLHGAIVRAYGSQAMPKLLPGDAVRISGRAASTGDAIQLSTTGAGITRLSGGELPASARGVGDISATDTGIAVTIRGLVARRTSATLVLADPDTGSEVPIRLAAPIDTAIAKGTTVDARGVIRVRSGDVEVMAIDKHSVSQVLLPPEPVAAAPMETPQTAVPHDARTFSAALPVKRSAIIPILVIAGSGAAIVAAILRRKRAESEDSQLLDAAETTR